MSVNTVQSYLHDFDHLSNYAIGKNTKPEDVMLEDLQHLLKCINELGIAPASQRRMIAGWRTFYRMMVADGALKDSPAAMLDLPLRPQHLPDVLTDEEIAKNSALIKEKNNG